MTLAERFTEFKRRVDLIAVEMQLEVEFTTEYCGSPYLPDQRACCEVSSSNPYEYITVPGRTIFGETGGAK